MLNYLRVVVDSFALRSGIARGQQGATLIEYALIIAAIAVVVLFGALSITGQLTGFFGYVGTQLPQS